MSLIHLFLLLGLLSLEAAASFSPGSRSILRDIGSNVADQKDNAIELNATNFDSVFQDSPAKYAVLEFFAHWSVFSFSLSLVKNLKKIQTLGF
jgi:thiol oxidase